MADARHALGLAAEGAVAAWLTQGGWTLLARRIRTDAGGEIDLVACDPGGVLVAIEVRARRSARSGIGAETIDRRWVARLGRSLVAFAATTRTRHTGLRIDLVLLEPVPGTERRWSVRRIPDIGGMLSG